MGRCQLSISTKKEYAGIYLDGVRCAVEKLKVPRLGVDAAVKEALPFANGCGEPWEDDDE